VGRLVKAMNHKTNMNAAGESDGWVVPTKSPNQGRTGASAGVLAEGWEGSHPTKRNTEEDRTHRTQSRGSVSQGLGGVREVARKDKKQKFTALLHHVTVERLRESYYGLKKQAAPGIDGVTWQQYGEEVEEQIQDLHDRIHRGAYRALPTKRKYIPKEDGRQRPLGIAALEDKIVQQAVVTVLNEIYEEDFLGFSYGFRPKRGQHDALDALTVGIKRKKVNWILDADIRGFFDNMDHEWLRQFVEYRIADRRILHLIQKWLKAGVSEEGEWQASTVGTPQGAVISPLLANIYLHYAFDLWAKQWREKQARGDMIIVRYADDIVLGFQYREEAEAFRQALGERLRKFGLELHPEKTRLIEFGRFAEENRERRGEGKPETFDFLGFTHACAKSQKEGWFKVQRRTAKKRLRSKLKSIGQELRKRINEQVTSIGEWLKKVVQGYFNYHAVPGNFEALRAFHREVTRRWHRVLRRRSQRARITWEQFSKLITQYLPRPRILHPYPEERFDRQHSR
jgi:RNA-directed DNA polymerase